MSSVIWHALVTATLVEKFLSTSRHPTTLEIVVLRKVVRVNPALVVRYEHFHFVNNLITMYVTEGRCTGQRPLACLMLRGGLDLLAGVSSLLRGGVSTT